MLLAAACRCDGVTPDRLSGRYQYLSGEILASRGRRFGNQIRSRARKQAVSASMRSSDSGHRLSVAAGPRQEGVSRFDAPRPTADTLSFWLRLVRVSRDEYV